MATAKHPIRPPPLPPKVKLVVSLEIEKEDLNSDIEMKSETDSTAQMSTNTSLPPPPSGPSILPPAPVDMVSIFISYYDTVE
jgi:hypothetical protein